MTRRLFLPLLCAPLLADSEDVLEMLTAIASALSEGNAAAFLGAFDRDIPEYPKIEGDVTALISQADVLCSVDVLTERGDDHNRLAEVDWFMQIRAKGPGGPLERRRQTVKVRIARRGKKWKIVGFEPAEILAALTIR